jgi:hypothetical protein
VAGYSTRQSTYTDGDVINAADSNDEFDQILAAFNASTGHNHDGTAGEGSRITVVGTAANNVTFGAALTPDADNTIDIGTSAAEFKDLYLDGVAYVDSIAMPTTTVTDILDEDTMSSNSATALATQQSIKAYVDSQVTAQDLDFSADTGGALSIDLDSESLTLTGGTGIDTTGSGNTVTFAIDSTVATLTGTQTLTNKTLTAPAISTISNTGTITLPTSTDTLVGRATTDTLTNKTLTWSRTVRLTSQPNNRSKPMSMPKSQHKTSTSKLIRVAHSISTWTASHSHLLVVLALTLVALSMPLLLLSTLL